MLRNVLFLLFCVIFGGGQSYAQLVEEFDPPRANCCLMMFARSLADQLQDWNQLGRYHKANQELKRRPPDPHRVVFMGDSITDLWNLEEYFRGKPYVNRGIGGQTTPQMLARFYGDVIDLQPGAVIILAGINDISRNTGPSTAEMVQHNFMAMTALATHYGVRVILCSLLPVSDYPYERRQKDGQEGGRSIPRLRMTETHPPSDILKLNAWLKEYAGRVGAVYADYFTALVDDKGWLKDGYSDDGLHPNAAGYRVMAPIAEAAIQKAFQLPRTGN